MQDKQYDGEVDCIFKTRRQFNLGLSTEDIIKKFQMIEDAHTQNC